MMSYYDGFGLQVHVWALQISPAVPYGSLTVLMNGGAGTSIDMQMMI